MSSGTFVAFGFFGLASGRRISVPKQSNPQAFTYYITYATTIQLQEGDPLPATLRIYSPPNDVPHPDLTIAFVVAKVHIPDPGAQDSTILLDAFSLHPVPGDPTSDDYEESVPQMLEPFMYGIGTTVGNHHVLPDGKSKAFTVKVSERVRDQQLPSSVQCVLGATPRWTAVPGPAANTLVHFLGKCHQLADDGTLQLNLEMVLYNPTAAEAPPPPTPANGGKKRKFNAFSSSPARSQRSASTHAVNAVAGPGPSTVTARAASKGKAKVAPIQDTPSSPLSDADLTPPPSPLPPADAGDTVDDADDAPQPPAKKARKRAKAT